MPAFPITSSCNLDCIFCSHKGNPSGIKTSYIKEVSKEDIFKRASCIKNSEVVIGESATRVVEGEPFIIPYIIDLLFLLAENGNKISITTSGILLKESEIKRLAGIPFLELNVSVNSTDPNYRKKYLGDSLKKDIREIITLLAQNNIDFNSSIVALNTEDGFSDVINTLEFLDRNKSLFNRIFVPGFTGFNRNKLFDYDISLLEASLYELRKKGVPVIIEPSFSETKVNVQAVIKDSICYDEDIRFNDVILSIDGDTNITSRDLHSRIKVPGQHILQISRDGKVIRKELIAEENKRSGLVLKDNIDSISLQKIDHMCSDDDIIICSVFAEPFFRDRFSKKRVLAARNKRFGGNISSNGLLAVSDIMSVLKKGQCRSIIIDPSFITNDGIDLFGDDIYRITYEKNINIRYI